MIGGPPLILEQNASDQDNDSIPDIIECPSGPPYCPDTNQNGIADYQDDDSDGDGFKDRQEWMIDTNGDGIYDEDDRDSDHNGVWDFLDPNVKNIPSAPVGQCSWWNYLPFGFNQGVTCGIELIRNYLRDSGVEVGDDPPVPGMLFSTSPFAALSGGVSQTVNVAPSHSDGNLSASLVVSHTILSGTLSAKWNTNSWVGAQFTSLSIPQAQVYDENNALLATGAVQARPASPPVGTGGVSGGPAVALALGDSLTYDIQGQGSASFYAPATNGLGVGGNWSTYTAHMQSTGQYGIGLRDAIVTVNGQEYTGTLVLVTSDPVTLTGSGHTLTPNFTQHVVIQAQDTQLLVGPSIGASTANVGSTPLDTAHGFALSGYTGPITITEETADTDRIELNGPVARDLTLAVDPTTSQVIAGQPTTFTAHINSNTAGLYVVVVEPFRDWSMAVDAQGTISVTPSLGTLPGDYPIRVGAAAADDTTLFATAVHTVTVLPHEGMELDVNPDVLTTVPWGPVATGEGVNDGRAQISGVAFTVDITNTSSSAHTFALEVVPSTFAADWIIFGTRRAPTATLTLPAGGVGQLGLYFQPPCDESSTSCDLPSAGSIHPFTVNAVAIDTGSLSANDADQFTVPALAFSYLTAEPTRLYSSPGLMTTFDLGLRNVGNTSGAFTLTLTLPITTWSATLPTSQATLAGGEVLTQTITLNTLTGDLGKDYRVSASAPSGPYAPTASVIVHLSSPEVRDIYQAAQDVDGLCVKNVSLQAALHYLGQALEELQAACQYSTELAGPGQATCSTDLRDRVVSGALAVANHSTSVSPIITADETLHSIAQELKTQTNWSSIQASVGDLRTAVNDLRTQVVTASSYNARPWFDPGMRVVLGDQPTTFNFNLTNAGCAAATYGITLTTSSEAMPLEPTSLEWTLQPGQTLSAPIVVTPTALGAYLLQANLLTHEAPQLPLLHTEASVSVVDALLELTKVTAQPAFVEYGSGVASAVSAQIFNVANIPLDARARVRVLDAIGTEVQTAVVPVSIGSTLLPLDYALGSIDTSSFVTGTYTIAVDIIDENDAVIPKASSQGVLNVGQAVHASSSVSPAIVAPGTVTVTTVITTELDSAIIQSLAQRLMRVPGLAALARFIPLDSLAVTPLAQTSEPLGLMLYADPDYTGAAESFTTDDPDLNDNAIGANTVSSIVLSDTTQAIVFSEPNYQGDWRRIIASVPNLTPLGFDDAIDSLKMLPYPTGPISITDQFASPTLDPAWNCTAVVDFGAACSLDESTGNLRLTIPAGDNGALENTQYLQRYDMGRGDFTLETHVTLADYDAQSSYWTGLALGLGDSERILFGLMNGDRLQVNRLYRTDETVTYAGSNAYLRVQKQGQALTFASRATENDDWQTLTTWFVSEPIAFVGLFARTGWDAAQLKADFDAVHLASDDIPIVVPPDPAPDVHDEFSSNTLRRPWMVSPLEGDAQYSLTDQPDSLRFVLPTGDTGSTVQVQRLDMADDWAIQTRLHLEDANICSGDCYRSGLVVGFTPWDYFTFGFAHNRQLRMERFNQYATAIDYASANVELRLEKTGNRYVFKYRAAAGDPWTILDTRYETSRVQWVGLIGRAWEPRTAPLILDYAYFDLTGVRVLGNGLKGEYFAGEELSGDPVITRIDPQIDFNWYAGSPAAEIGPDYFSARWTGYIEAPTSDVYEFATIADDGTRLWVNGQELIGEDNWTTHGAEPVYGTSALTLTAGQRYSITLAYFEHDGDASAELWWYTDAIGWQKIPTERLYPADGVWSLVVEPPTLPADGVSPATITIKLYDAADQPLADQPVEVQISGSRNRLNDQPIPADDWTAIGASDASGVVTATLTSSLSEPKIVRARVQGILLAPEVITFTTTEPVGLQILLPGEEVAQDNANGKAGTPLPHKAGAPFDVIICAVDAQWNTASHITDTVIVTSTDPQAVLPASLELVNGVATATVTLSTLGAHTLGALAPDQTTWPVAESSSLLVQRAGIGLTGEYFDNTLFSGDPVLRRLDPQIDFAWHGIAPAPEIDPEYFAVRWTGQLEAPTSGEYTFYTSADDGVRVSLNDVELIDAWEPPFTPYDSHSESVPLIAGQRYTLTIEYVNFEGDADAHLEWSGPSIPRQIIPSRYLYPDVGFWTAEISPQFVPADGVAAATAEVHLLDGSEQPSSEVPLTLWTDSDYIYANGQPLEADNWLPIGLSAADGTFTAVITSTVVGNPLVRLKAQDLVLAEANITFTALPPVGLQILLPGEFAAPGEPDGKAGWPHWQTAGQAFEVQVRAVDANFNATLATGVITLTSTDDQFDGPLTATLDQGVVIFSVVLKTAGTRNFTVEHAELSQVSDAEVYVLPAPAVSLTLEAPETAELLMSIPLTVTANDVYGNAAYNQVQYASSDPQATLPQGASPAIIFRHSGVQTVTARIGSGLIQTVTITLPSNDVTITDFASLPSGTYTYGNVVVTSNGRLGVGNWCGTSGVTLSAQNVTIEEGGWISASHLGSCDRSQPGAGHEGSGAGHGGRGGARFGVAGGEPYGSIYQPDTLGSRGGSANVSTDGGPGGGALHLIVDGTLLVQGLIAADAGDGWSDQTVNGGGGSGGSLWIETQVLTGTGLIRANGGRGDVGSGLSGGGGAGGRIAIDADVDHFTGNLQVNGGSGAEAGQTGTIYLRVDPVSSHISVPFSQPTSLTGEVITVTLVTTTGTPIANEPVSLKLLAGQPLTLSTGVVLSTAMTYIGTTNDAGVVTTTLASTRPGTSEIEAWVGAAQQQRRLLTSATVVIVTGPADPVRSKVTLNTNQLTIDGVTPVEFTVTLSDTFNNPAADRPIQLITTGEALTITPSVLRTNLAGVARGQLLSTRAQTVTVYAVDTTYGITLTAQPTVTFLPGPASAATSMLIVTPTQVYADGRDALLATVLLRDAYDNGVPDRRVDFSVPGTAITITPPFAVTDFTGQAQATIVARDVQTVTLTALDAEDGLVLTPGSAISFVPGKTDPDRSPFNLAPNTLIADGLSTADITIMLRDAAYQPRVGKVVTLTVTGQDSRLTGPIPPVTGDNGVVTFTLASTQVETKTITAIDLTDEITLTPRLVVTFTVGPVDVNASTLTTNKTTLLADGVDAASLTAILYDSYGHPIPDKSVRFLTNGTQVTVPPTSLTTNAQGRAQATLRSTDVQTVTVMALDDTDGLTVTQSVTLTFVAGPAVAAHSTAIVTPTTLIADGEQRATITVTLRDALDHPASDRLVRLTATGENPLQGYTDAAGSIVFHLASTRAGSKHITIADVTDNVTLDAGTIVFEPGPIDPAVSTLTASADAAPNDGLTPITITAQLMDAYRNPIAQEVVTFTVSDPRITLTSPTATSNADGYARSAAIGTAQQPFTVTARAGEIDLNRQLVLRFSGPDLDVTTQGPTTGIIGQNMTHTLHVKNEGLAVAPGVVITGELPDHLTLLSADGVYTPTEDEHHIVWEVGDLSAHQAVTFTMMSAIDPAAPLDGQLATHFQAVTPAEELNLNNNSTSLSIRVLPAHLFTATLNPAQQTTSIGAVATYPSVVKNIGNLPDRFSVSIAGLASTWFTVNPIELALRPGESARATVQVVVTDCAASGVYPITATITSAGSAQAQVLPARLTLVSNPLQLNLSPRNGATSGSTSVLFTWQTPVSATGLIRLWPVGDVSHIQTYTATGEVQHNVTVSGLQRDANYQWYAHSESACGMTDSPGQTLSIGHGVVFTQRGYAYTIQRDYDQRFDIAVTNQDPSFPHTVVLTMTAPDSGDLIVGFTGAGSVDQPLVLQKGETRFVTLALHAQDAQAHDYTLTAQLTADDGGAAPIVDAVPVQVHVAYPGLDVAIEEIDRNPETLVSTYRVTNRSDAPLTDLALSVEVISGTGTLYLTPGMTHGYLNPGQRFEFEAYPAIESDFTGLSAQLVATAAGVSRTLPVTLTLPEGKSLFLGEADNVSLEVSNRDWYCTNKPVIDNFLTLPNGFHRAEMDSAQLRLSLSSQSDVRPHNLAVEVNEQPVGGFQNLIPNGIYTYSVAAGDLMEAAYGPTTNDVRFKTTHLNGGHYMVASNVSLGVCLNRYREWVVADSQAAANTAVASRSFIVPAPQTLDVEILSPHAGTRLLAGVPTPVIARVTDDVDRSWSHIVVVQASPDNGSLMLYDDGYHGDGAPRDGVYGGTWWPTQPGTIELTAQAGSCSLTGSAALTVTVRNPQFATQIDHQVPVSNVQVLTGTYLPDPAGTIFNDQQVQLSWQQVLTPGGHTKTALFQAVLPDMRAGEVREVATGTVINYSGESGDGQVHLGSLSVVAPHLVALTPLSRTIGVGMSGVYQVELYNPAESSETLTPIVTGLPASWLSDLPVVTLPAQARISLPLTITVPADEVVGVRTLAVVVHTDHGGQDQAAAQLNVTPLLAVQVDPPLNSGSNGQVVTYTATITNFTDVAQHYALASTGLAGNLVSLPSGVDVPPQTAVVVPFSITIYADRGPHPFAITAQVADTNAVGRGAAVLVATGDRRVATGITPPSAEGGPLVPTLYHLIITNTGSLSDTYRFNVALPEGWTYTLTANGEPIDRLSLTPYVFSEAELWLIVTPAAGTLPRDGGYDFTVTTQSLNDPQVRSVADANLTVTNYGVQVDIVPEHTTLNPTETGTWQVIVKNTGSAPDSYSLMAGGIVSASAQFAPASVSLAPGESQAVQLTSRDMDFALPQTYPFAVTARSTSQLGIQNFDMADITFNGYQAVQVEFLPAAQTITDSLQASYLMVITNTGNVDTVYRLSASSPALSLQIETDEVYLPAHMTAGVLLTARASQGGLYFITGSAAALSSAAQDGATAVLLINLSNHVPEVQAGADQMVLAGSPVIFNGAFTDPDPDDTHTITWDFGDGAVASGTLTPTHVYGQAGMYHVTLTVTDQHGATATDSLIVTVSSASPIVNAGADRTATEGEWLSFSGTFTDPTPSDTHEIVWDFGDGITLTGTLTPAHLYADNGIYLVTLTVTDSAGGVGQSTLHVTVNNAPPQVDAGVNQTVLEGDVVPFNGTFTDLGAIDTHTIQWDFGDGTTANGVLTPTHVYIDNGVYTATLTVIDKDGGSGIGTVLITVDNVVPTVDAGPDQTVARGQTAYFNGLFTDPGAVDTHTVTWTFGDGTTVTGTLAPTHRYANSGVYTATLTITDDDGGVGSDALVITVQAVVPTVNAGADQSATEGEAVNFTGAFSGTGALSGYTFTWNFGDGANASGTLTPTHTYADDGVYAVTLNITDDEGQVGSDTLLVTVTNVAPTVEAGSDENTIEGALVSFNGAFTDPGVLDTHAYHWNFGDGLTASGALTATHVYTRSGVYTATLTVTDDDGGVGSDVLRVTVVAQPVACALYPIALHASTVASATIGQALPDVYNGADQVTSAG
jgi:PKD repeat protein/uncharacterized membrane protein